MTPDLSYDQEGEKRRAKITNERQIIDPYCHDLDLDFRAERFFICNGMVYDR